MAVKTYQVDEVTVQDCRCAPNAWWPWSSWISKNGRQVALGWGMTKEEAVAMARADKESGGLISKGKKKWRYKP